jgi:hypothetical protein
MIVRLLMLALGAMPRGLRRSLDDWSYRIAMQKRRRRLQLARAK